ncbi:p-hydroxyphenylacetate 3-hydroxylase, reductase component [compost metagenome]
MTQAVRSYQADYQPRQLASGLRTSEARMLMVLENDCGLDMNGLQREVAMPMREIEQSVDILKRKGLVEDRDTGCFGLTAEGIEQTEALWTIASEQQGRVFADFSPEQIETFKRMLKQVIGSA